MELDVGGVRYVTSVEALRREPHMHHCGQRASVAVVGGEADGGGDMDLFGSLVARAVHARH